MPYPAASSNHLFRPRSLPFHEDSPTRGRQQTVDQLERGRLSRTAAPEQHYYFPALNLEIEARQDSLPARPIVGHIAKLDRRTVRGVSLHSCQAYQVHRTSPHGPPMSQRQPFILSVRVIQSANRRRGNPRLRFCQPVFGNSAPGMSVSTLSRLVCFALILILPQSLLAIDTGSAIIHTQGGVWVNGTEVPDSTAIFPGDLLETKPGFAANLTTDGSTALIQPESIVKFQGDVLVLEHGSVSLGTSKAMRVQVNCLTVVPVSTEWTQYEVTDVTGRVLVAARKNDIKINREGGLAKLSKEPETGGGAIVHEGEQSTREESAVCGA